MHNKEAPKVIKLADYQPSAFLCEEIFLHVDLHEDHTKVSGVLHLQRNPDAADGSSDLVLNGVEMALEAVRLDGHKLGEDRYTIDEETLTIHDVPQKCVLETDVIIHPERNAALNGLYQSSGNFCTQCEPHGFRHITYALDRSDVLSRFTTTISADKNKYPMLLSNGNLIEERDLEDGRHWVKWVDPSFKPSYLFALVAGDFDRLDDTFNTMSGRPIQLQIFVEKGNLDQADYAMQSLKNAMRWDEEAFGREYDLDIYMIVAVSDFNMGAMENKGLNLFNDKYILAKPETATDTDYINIESVIGHEYFHNWSGNRITVRDWFQITLKEGLTIFRDQSFTADQTSHTVKRIHDVNVIRNVQFAQDAGPMAHPIRPRSYIEINNFYTVTVYNKGSEVIRMMQTMLGKEKFRQAMDTYFSRFDGKAVTTEDFVAVMAETAGRDFSQFQRWYDQAGTPTLTIRGEYDPDQKIYTMNVKQSCPPTKGQPDKEPFVIPLAVGLIGKDGKDLPVQVNGGAIARETNLGHTFVIEVNQAEQTFSFTDVTEEPVPSLLRTFSAPVKVDFPYTDEDRLFLMQHDIDGFNRWDAGQQLAVKLLLDAITAYRRGVDFESPTALIEGYRQLMKTRADDLSLLSEMLCLPAVSYLIELMPVADVDAIYHVREAFKHAIARGLREELTVGVEKYSYKGAYELTADAMAARKFRNLCLHYLVLLDEKERARCVEQFQSSNNLTDRIGALSAINQVACEQRDHIFSDFSEQYAKYPLVLDKWFALQAMATVPGTLDTVKHLMQHPAFNIKNPNRARSLIGAFGSGNPLYFHQQDGSGYQFLTDQVLAIDGFNPQVAARIAEPLIRWRKFDPKRQQLMKEQLERIKATPKLSKDVYELATKSLEE